MFDLVAQLVINLAIKLKIMQLAKSLINSKKNRMTPLGLDLVLNVELTVLTENGKIMFPFYLINK